MVEMDTDVTCMGLDGTGVLRAQDCDGTNGRHGYQRRWRLHSRHLCRFCAKSDDGVCYR